MTDIHTTSCSRCSGIPSYLDGDRDGGNSRFEPLVKPLVRLPGQGRFYRGEEMQLSTYTLWQCPQCGTVYEYGHHCYSDPASTMGLSRDESDWYDLTRLTPEQAAQRLIDIQKG